MKKLQDPECELTDYIRKDKIKDTSCDMITLSCKDRTNNKGVLRNKNSQKK